MYLKKDAWIVAFRASWLLERYLYNLAEQVQQGQATGAALISSLGSAEAAGTSLADVSDDGEGRGGGVRGISKGKARAEVSNSALRRGSAFNGLKARNAQTSVQVRSIPRSVQDIIIWVNGMVADGFMGTTSC